MSTTSAPLEHHALGSEFEHEPVPPAQRRSLRSVSAVWFGFPMICTNAVFGGNALNLPVWGIFICWAATYLAGGPHRGTLMKLWPTMAAGSTFALVIVLLGRTRAFALIPGMFLGFASYFATMFGGSGERARPAVRAHRPLGGRPRHRGPR
jgi:hypothetical protein